MFNRSTRTEPTYDQAAEAAAHQDGYFWRQETHHPVSYAYGHRNPLRTYRVDTEEEARRAMVRLHQAHTASREASVREFEQQQKRREEEDRARKEVQGTVDEANRRNARDAGYRITRPGGRSDSTHGWAPNEGRHEWDTAEAAIATQQADADRNRAHQAFRNRVAAALADAGGRYRWETPGLLVVHLPKSHPKAPDTGDVIGGMMHAFTGRGWADLADWWGGDFNRPDDYPDTE